MKTVPLLGVLAVYAQCHGANIVRNGSFEATPVGTTVGQHFFGADSLSGGTFFDGWVVGGDSVDLVGSELVIPAEGNQSVDLVGIGGGYIYQDLNVVPGNSYHLRYATSANAARRFPLLMILRASVDQDYVETVQFDSSRQSRAGELWDYHEADFVATKAVIRLMFTAISLIAYSGPAVDDISLIGIGSAIWPPIPPYPAFEPVPGIFRPPPPWNPEVPIPDSGSCLPELLLGSASLLVISGSFRGRK